MTNNLFFKNPFICFIIKLIVILSILLLIIFLYLKLNLNSNYDFLTILKDILIPSIHAELVDVEFIKVHAEDLQYIKNHYCSDDIHTYLFEAVHSQLNLHSTDFLLKGPSPDRLLIPSSQGQSGSISSSFNLSEYFYIYRNFDNTLTGNHLPTGWPRSGWLLPIKNEYAREVIEIINKNN
jgi:hypothetical protein